MNPQDKELQIVRKLALAMYDIPKSLCCDFCTKQGCSENLSEYSCIESIENYFLQRIIQKYNKKELTYKNMKTMLNTAVFDKTTVTWLIIISMHDDYIQFHDGTCIFDEPAVKGRFYADYILETSEEESTRNLNAILKAYIDCSNINDSAFNLDDHIHAVNLLKGKYQDKASLTLIDEALKSLNIAKDMKNMASIEGIS